MSTTPRSTKRKRLDLAGWTYCEGWLPKREAIGVLQLIARHRDEALDLATTKLQRGRKPPPQTKTPLE